MKDITIDYFKLPETFPSVCSEGSLYLDSAIRISIFFVPKGTKMLLHDHPGMYVICKVLQGRLTRHAYSLQDSLQQTTFPKLYVNSVQKHEPTPSYPRVVASKHSDILLPGDIDVVTPTDNLHQFVAEDDSIFLDLISPDYDNIEIFMNTYTEVETIEGGIVVLQMGPPKLLPNVKVSVDFR